MADSKPAFRQVARGKLTSHFCEDAAQARENLLRMIALKERLPELIIVPAHDMRALRKCRRYLRQAGEASAAPA